MMRRTRGGLLPICLAFVLTSVQGADEVIPALPAQGVMQVAFTPWDDVEGLIGDAIEGARKQVLVQAYLLTSKKIAATLVAARRRGIDVRVLVDAEQAAKAASAASTIAELAQAGILIWMETKYQHAHNKVIVIDQDTSDAAVITGSYNLTWTAQHRNAENILISRRNPALAARYASNWERHRREALPYNK